MDLELAGKRALVTGSSRGLGYAVGLVLAREGCSVTLNARDAAALAVAAKTLSKESGQDVIGLPGDVSDKAVPQALVDKSAEAMGGLDLLVTNAGGPPPGSFESFDEAAWQNALDLAFMCHVRLIRSALPYLRKSQAASVLTMTSYVVKEPMLEPGAFEQHPPGDDGVDQEPGAGARFGGHTVQFDPAGQHGHGANPTISSGARREERNDAG